MTISSVSRPCMTISSVSRPYMTIFTRRCIWVARKDGCTASVGCKFRCEPLASQPMALERQKRATSRGRTITFEYARDHLAAISRGSLLTTTVLFQLSRTAFPSPSMGCGARCEGQTAKPGRDYEDVSGEAPRGGWRGAQRNGLKSEVPSDTRMDRYRFVNTVGLICGFQCRKAMVSHRCCPIFYRTCGGDFPEGRDTEVHRDSND